MWEKKSRPHAWDRREVENDSSDEVRTEVKVSGREMSGEVGEVMLRSMGAA
jgi:hypothetical protein